MIVVAGVIFSFVMVVEKSGLTVTVAARGIKSTTQQDHCKHYIFKLFLLLCKKLFASNVKKFNLV